MRKIDRQILVESEKHLRREREGREREGEREREERGITSLRPASVTYVVISSVWMRVLLFVGLVSLHFDFDIQATGRCTVEQQSIL